ncbi:tyrosine-protein phosphatase non-receptor type substrate 1 isoform X1 [Monodelphis domestica]|uniref:tyrosine-protein phosphatase non-receptor type substrate 1 isoform X1 n=1 Tax=Monodelphis domestica TaxID=13616 RepID=UPI0024E2193D|nr:tyrosine-protein phosphatase non-receptor type substrate 1 isoform X1 [Monodelphis domestica]XP_056668354.1 tyrosine-protein phosphatase non-receptor type substrate 1 isoform X1 [Monodelphis domestica]XP_056668355.1 tyrosine-protein phosphatase non-receptor type substrate 1 isoform X1 [Monodelphis domestica]XP_056668356.1 tyrosine-protein phosphatase non-receptor type substrate 1 isoform X1 [Monodelphis domestica]XP_056668357.1 tyrosine-protein phosphatase non-receptor type substrate 1 isofo
MEPAQGSRRLRSWSLICLLLAASHSWSGAQGEELQVLQPKEPVSVAKGLTVTLNCTATDASLPGPVKWFKGAGPQRKEIYNFRGGSYPRIKAVVPSSNTDFSINISNITPEDTGTYYCVKFKKGNPDTEFKSGGGTMLSVRAKPSQPLVSGPQGRINVGQVENFTCKAHGFSPKDIKLKWLKNNNDITTNLPKIFPENNSVSYNITSTTQVKLEANDVHSKIICEVDHETLETPLQGKMNLSSIIRVLPKVNIYRDLLPMNLANVTCEVKKFFPNIVDISWLENGTERDKIKNHNATENNDGTYSFNASFQVNMSLVKEAKEITCVVTHDSQTSISNKTIIPLISHSGKTDETKESQQPQNIFIAVSIVSIVLVALLIATIYLIRAKQKKAKGSTSSTRLHEPEKNARDLSQIQDSNDINNDITYADLNLPRGKKSAPRAVESNNQTEYASIQTGPSPQREDNLTYADLDMVHLNRSSKKATTRPEESYSEYASVQVQRK